MNKAKGFEGTLLAQYAGARFWALQTAQATYELRGPVPDLAGGTRVWVIARLAADAPRTHRDWPVLQVLTVSVL